MFTGKGREEVAIRALNLGADHYVNKVGQPETVYYELADDLRKAVERKQTQGKLSHERDLIQTLLEHYPGFIYFKDRKARFHRVSRRFCDFFKCREEDIIGKTDLDLFPKEIAEQTYSEDLCVIKTGRPLIDKEENAAGTWVLTTKMPWFDHLN